MWICIIAAMLLVIAGCLLENDRIQHTHKKKERPAIEKVERQPQAHKKPKWPYGD
jgi:hypothetical protein